MGEYIIVICGVRCDCFLNFQHQVLPSKCFLMADNREVGAFELFVWTGSGNPNAAPATVIGENYSATANSFVGRG